MKSRAAAWCSLAAVLSRVTASSIDDYQDGPWRTSLHSVWLEELDSRVMATSHSGDWDLEFPFDSLPAIARAAELGMDAVKANFRVASDGVGVVMHSSPIEFWESFNCFNRFVENMTSAECTQCNMALTDYKFITVPDLLAWSDGKINVMFTVKKETDLPRAIATIIEEGASERSFIECPTPAFLGSAVGAPNWNSVYYLPVVASLHDWELLTAASAKALERVLLVHFNNLDRWDEDDLKNCLAEARQRGFRTFAKTGTTRVEATVRNHVSLYEAGIDVTYSYNNENAAIARQQWNEANGVFPA